MRKRQKAGVPMMKADWTVQLHKGRQIVNSSNKIAGHQESS